VFSLHVQIAAPPFSRFTEYVIVDVANALVHTAAFGKGVDSVQKATDYADRVVVAVNARCEHSSRKLARVDHSPIAVPVGFDEVATDSDRAYSALLAPFLLALSDHEVRKRTEGWCPDLVIACSLRTNASATIHHNALAGVQPELILQAATTCRDNVGVSRHAAMSIGMIPPVPSDMPAWWGGSAMSPADRAQAVQQDMAEYLKSAPWAMAVTSLQEESKKARRSVSNGSILHSGPLLSAMQLFCPEGPVFPTGRSTVQQKTQVLPYNHPHSCLPCV
jgi:hypothetical protein